MQVLKRWLPAILLMVVIFVLSSVPGQNINEAGLGNDSYHITGHFLFFFVLYLAFYRATASLGLSLLLTIIYAVIDELHQMYTPGRASSLKDIITDTAAGITAGALIWSLYPKLPKKLKDFLKA